MDHCRSDTLAIAEMLTSTPTNANQDVRNRSLPRMTPRCETPPWRYGSVPQLVGLKLQPRPVHRLRRGTVRGVPEVGWLAAGLLRASRALGPVIETLGLVLLYGHKLRPFAGE